MAITIIIFLTVSILHEYICTAYYMHANRITHRSGNTGGCTSTYISWDSRIVKQLPDSVLARLPVVPTYRYACDRTVVSLLRAHTLGNSTTALHHNILEGHSEEWLKRQLMYLGDCARVKESRQKLGLHTVEYPEAPPFPVPPIGL